MPGIAYTIPDLDGIVQVYIHDAETGESLACVEAALSNGKTVYQKGVGWVTAIIAGTGLVASAITNGLGHSNTAAHVAANALSLFGYFQAQAFIGMSAVPLPPIVSSWTQNFQWSMGIIRIRIPAENGYLVSALNGRHSLYDFVHTSHDLGPGTEAVSRGNAQARVARPRPPVQPDQRRLQSSRDEPRDYSPRHRTGWFPSAH